MRSTGTDCLRTRNHFVVFPETPESAVLYHFHVVLIIYINHFTCNNSEFCSQLICMVLNRFIDGIQKGCGFVQALYKELILTVAFRINRHRCWDVETRSVTLGDQGIYSSI